MGGIMVNGLKRLGTAKLLFIALGTVGTGLMVNALGMYTLRFYAPTEEVGLPLLVPIGWIGIVQGISLAFDCLIDPLIASWSDNSKNPKGRRVPFMRLALIPTAIFAILVFFAPMPQVSVVNALWVLGMFLAYSFTRSLFDINLQALIPELIPDSHRRLRLIAIRTAIGLVGIVLISLVPGIVEGMRGSGVEAISAWRILLSIVPVISLVLMAPAGLFIRETDYIAPAPAEQARTPLFASIRETLSLKTFRTFVIAATLFTFAAGISTTALLFYIDVLFGMEGGMGSVMQIAMILVSFLFYPVVLPLSRRVGKKPLLMVSVAVCAVGYAVIFFYGPLGALFGTAPLAADSFWTQIAGEGVMSGYIGLIVLLAVIFGFPITAGNLLTNATFADIIQYHAIRSGRTRSGMFYAAINVILAIPSTLVPASVGLLIYLGTTNDMPTVIGVQSTAILAVAACIPSFIIFSFYREREVLDIIQPFAQGAGGAGAGGVEGGTGGLGAAGAEGGVGGLGDAGDADGDVGGGADAGGGAGAGGDGEVG
jgi:GPH family glycoside/pentoside/hexuronide:cation symporter